MDDDTCNGWSNRETWSFMLWVNNDEGLQDMACSAVADLDAWEAANALKEWADTLFTRAGFVDTFGDSWPDALADAASEVGSFDRIDWRECVESLQSDLGE